jgi:hypothetical protein
LQLQSQQAQQQEQTSGAEGTTTTTALTSKNVTVSASSNLTIKDIQQNQAQTGQNQPQKLIPLQSIQTVMNPQSTTQQPGGNSTITSRPVQQNIQTITQAQVLSTTSLNNPSQFSQQTQPNATAAKPNTNPATTSILIRQNQPLNASQISTKITSSNPQPSNSASSSQQPTVDALIKINQQLQKQQDPNNASQPQQQSGLNTTTITKIVGPLSSNQASNTSVVANSGTNSGVAGSSNGANNNASQSSSNNGNGQSQIITLSAGQANASNASSTQSGTTAFTTLIKPINLTLQSQQKQGKTIF